MSCVLKAPNGSISNLATKLGTKIANESDLRNLYYKTALPQFASWYGDAKRDANGEPVLSKDKAGNLTFVNADGDVLTLDDVMDIYPDAPLSVTDPLTDVEEAKAKIVAENPEYAEANAEQIELEALYVADIKRRLVKKKNRYEHAKSGASKTSEIEALLKQFEGLKTATAIHSYFSFALKEASRMEAKAQTIMEDGGSLSDMSFVLDYVNAFSNIVDVYNIVAGQKIPGSEEVFNSIYFDKVIATTLGKVNRIQTWYKSFARNAVAEKLITYNRNASLTKQDLEVMLIQTTGDINALHYWMDSMAESDDQVLALVDRAVKEERGKIAKEMAEFKNGEMRKNLEALEAYQKSQGISITNYEKMYEFMLEYEDGPDGKPRMTGNYLSPDQVLESVNGDTSNPRYKFANMFWENHTQALAMLPDVYGSNAGRIPTIMKSSTERAIEQGTGKAIVEGIKDSLTFRADETEYGDVQVFTDENGNQVRYVPVHYVSKVGYSEEGGKQYSVSPDQLSTNLASTLMQFMTMARNQSSMTELVPYFEAAKKLLAERDVEVSSSGLRQFVDKGLAKEGIRKTITKKGDQTRAYEMLTEYLNAHVYGEFKIDAGTFSVGSWEIDGNKVAEGLIKYTATTSLALNLFSGASNVVMGTLMNGIEAGSAMFFTGKDYRSAIKEYGKLIPSFMKDASSRFASSDMGLFMESFDIFQEFNEHGEVLEYKNGLLRNGNKALYFMQNSGEHFIQGSHAIAMMKGHRIYNGKAVSYFEWLDATGNSKNKDSKKEFEQLKDVYSSVKVTEDADGKKSVTIEGLDLESSLEFTERIKGNYQHNHGNYARQDAPQINRYWYGKMLMLFRRWLKPGINRRFSKKYYDQRLGHEFEGNYRTTAKFMQSLIKDFKTVGLGFVMYWNTPQYQQLTHWEQAQITKTFREAMVLSGAALLAMVVANLNGDDEEEKVWALSFAEFLANRTYQEVFTFTNPKEFIKTLRSPTATLSVLEDGVKAFTSFVSWDRYKAGEHKGDLKFVHQTLDMVPLWNQFEKITNINEIIKFQRQ